MNHQIKVSESLLLCGHVLWQQGCEPCLQPMESEENILLFNGDIFMDRENLLISDTEWLFEKIQICETKKQLLELFKTIKGPYSFIYYNKKWKKLFFGRDSLGRNSLLVGKTGDDIVLTSTIQRSKDFKSVIELPPLGIYCYDFVNLILELNPWKDVNSHELYLEQVLLIEDLLDTKIIIQNVINPIWTRQIELEINYLFKDIPENSDIFKELTNFPAIQETSNKIIKLLSQSVKERIENTSPYCKNCIKSKITCTHPRVGILFSGGIDCTILAALSNKYIKNDIPIDLMNVAFEKVRKNQNSEINWDVPDRITGRQSIEELRKIFPERKWNLIEVNITRIELNSFLTSHITHLVNPLTSVLDESLSGALWFAARGKGLLNNELYESPVRILLFGSGADELFGGYTRHRNAFLRENNGTNNPTLLEELELDWVRLPSRNLARDDRTICDHGVTSRAPFVQEDLTHFVRNLKPLQKCYHALEPGVGDKLLLRFCGYKLGLVNCAVFKKKALQFGSRIADSRQNAKDVSNLI